MIELEFAVSVPGESSPLLGNRHSGLKGRATWESSVSPHSVIRLQTACLSPVEVCHVELGVAFLDESGREIPICHWFLAESAFQQVYPITDSCTGREAESRIVDIPLVTPARSATMKLTLSSGSFWGGTSIQYVDTSNLEALIAYCIELEQLSSIRSNLVTDTKYAIETEGSDGCDCLRGNSTSGFVASLRRALRELKRCTEPVPIDLQDRTAYFLERSFSNLIEYQEKANTAAEPVLFVGDLPIAAALRAHVPVIALQPMGAQEEIEKCELDQLVVEVKTAYFDTDWCSILDSSDDQKTNDLRALISLCRTLRLRITFLVPDSLQDLFTSLGIATSEDRIVRLTVSRPSTSNDQTLVGYPVEPLLVHPIEDDRRILMGFGSSADIADSPALQEMLAPYVSLFGCFFDMDYAVPNHVLRPLVGQPAQVSTGNTSNFSWIQHARSFSCVVLSTGGHRDLQRLESCAARISTAGSIPVLLNWGHGAVDSNYFECIDTPQQIVGLLLNLRATFWRNERLTQIQEYVAEDHVWESHHLNLILRDRSQAPNGITAICATRRPENLLHVLETYRAGRIENSELIVIANTNTFSHEAELRADERLIHMDASFNIGTCLNRAVGLSQFRYWLKFDDDDHYNSTYLQRALMLFRWTGADVVGTQARLLFFPDRSETVLRGQANREFRDLQQTVQGEFVSGTWLAGDSKSLIPPFSTRSRNSCDSRFVAECLRRGHRVFSDVPTQVVVTRNPFAKHTWRPPVDHVSGQFVCSGNHADHFKSGPPRG